MKSNQIIGLLAGIAAACALFLACDTNEESCLTDTDCPTGDVCEGEVCTPECVDSSTCSAGQICVSRPGGGAGNICQDDPNANNVNNSNNANNSNNLNNLNNVNNSTSYFLAEIRDTTGTECDGTDPGSDIIYVSLEEADGTILGFGALVDDGTTGDNNENNLGANLDGNPPGSTETCPDFNDGTVTALGCGGFVTVEFLDDLGQRVGGGSGQQIRVFEFGTQCATGTDTDEYDIYLCTDPSNTPGSCSINIGGGSGEIAATIP